MRNPSSLPRIVTQNPCVIGHLHALSDCPASRASPSCSRAPRPIPLLSLLYLFPRCPC
uniref:Uncharacterized protein n=1 Tax=Arundo donax TaxID=35708 RepID=A0A0A9HXT7_ARUDO